MVKRNRERKIVKESCQFWNTFEQERNQHCKWKVKVQKNIDGKTKKYLIVWNGKFKKYDRKRDQGKECE